MFAGFTLLLAGCTSAPVFDGIESVTVIVQTEMGITHVDMKGSQLAAAKDCLYGTEEIAQEDAKSELLQEILMLEVKDLTADRTFELYTDENFHGSKKYYRNKCIFKPIKTTPPADE